jgi:hypothetical protein
MQTLGSEDSGECAHLTRSAIPHSIVRFWFESAKGFCRSRHKLKKSYRMLKFVHKLKKSHLMLRFADKLNKIYLMLRSAYKLKRSYPMLRFV